MDKAKNGKAAPQAPKAPAKDAPKTTGPVKK